jgi:hypothetical protein
MLQAVGIAALVAALDGNLVAPSPSPSPLTEIHHETSTPFCTVFRENVFHAVQGLTINDGVIDRGGAALNRLAHDPYGHSMAEYQLGQTVYQAAHNLTKIYQLLNDSARFPQSSTAEGDRDLLLMKQRLQAVADAQERSLNILSGTYESDALNELFNEKSPVADTLSLDAAHEGDAAKEETPELGTPLLKSGIPQPGQTSGPVITPTAPPGAETGYAISHDATMARMDSGLRYTERLTDDAESLVASAVLPGINRCNGYK